MTEYYVTYSKANRYKVPHSSQNRTDLEQTQKAHALAQRQLQQWHYEMHKVDRELRRRL